MRRCECEKMGQRACGKPAVLLYRDSVAMCQECYDRKAENLRSLEAVVGWPHQVRYLRGSTQGPVLRMLDPKTGKWTVLKRLH